MSKTECAGFLNTRHRDAALRMENEKTQKTAPRLGRRESEPHSHKINYIHDVLSTNFPNDRIFWDLHHYFVLGEVKLDIQFDISYFKNFPLKEQLSSYNELEFDLRRPTMTINILSKSTYTNDIGLTANNCMMLGIPVYVAFSDHLPKPEAVKAPHLEIYYKENNKYSIETLKDYCCVEGDEEIDLEKTIDILPQLIPFKYGIMKLNDKYRRKGKLYDLYQLIFIDRKTGTRLKTKAEQERERADRERERAEQERERANRERERAERERERADREKKEKEEALKRIEELERQLGKK